MPVEFALRPRIRLREAPAPPRRARARLPKFALPALAYWLVIGGLVYEFVQRHEPSQLPAEAEATLAPLPAPDPAPVRPWWRPLPARPASDVPVAPLVEPPTQQPEAPSSETPLAELHAPPPAAQPELTLEAEPNLNSEPPVDREPPFNAAPPLDSEAPLAVARRTLKRSERQSAAAAPSEPTRAPDPIAALSLPALDERPPAAPPPPAPAPTHAPMPDNARPVPTGGLPSCESAIASASQDVDFSGGNRAADLPSQAIAAVLENGVWLSSCNVPERTSLEICVAIKGGRVVGASVNSRPADASVNACVRRRASSLQFPYSPHLDVARTRF